MKRFTLLPLATVLLLLNGCLTPPASSERAAPVQPATAGLPGKFQRLQRGLTAQQVIELCGSPDKREPFPTELTTRAEKWTYEETLATEQRQVPVSTREVPYVDPITGVQRMLQEPVYELQSIQLVETVELLMLEGQLLNWKSTRSQHRSWQNTVN